MKIAKYVIPVGLVLFALASAAVAQDVRTDYDRNANFSQFHTYYWAKVQTENPLWQDRVQQAVDKDLQSKGWQRVESGGDIAVTAVGAAQNQQEYQTFYNNIGPGWWWGGFGPEATTTAVNYRTGTLVVDLYNAQTKHLVWRGIATDTLSDKPEKNERKLDKSVDKLFEHFPPHER